MSMGSAPGCIADDERISSFRRVPMLYRHGRRLPRYSFFIVVFASRSEEGPSFEAPDRFPSFGVGMLCEDVGVCFCFLINALRLAGLCVWEFSDSLKRALSAVFAGRSLFSRIH